MSRGSGENRYVWDENMNAAMIGDNCIDVYVRINGEEVNRRYPTGHLKAMLTGNHCHFMICDGVLQRGGAQDVHFCEFDGPASKNVLVIVEGQ